MCLRYLNVLREKEKQSPFIRVKIVLFTYKKRKEKKNTFNYKTNRVQSTNVWIQREEEKKKLFLVVSKLSSK